MRLPRILVISIILSVLVQKIVSVPYVRKERSCPSCPPAADLTSLRFPLLYCRPCPTSTRLNVYEECNYATSWLPVVDVTDELESPLVSDQSLSHGCQIGNAQTVPCTGRQQLYKCLNIRVRYRCIWVWNFVCHSTGRASIDGIWQYHHVY